MSDADSVGDEAAVVIGAAVLQQGCHGGQGSRLGVLGPVAQSEIAYKSAHASDSIR